MRSTSTQADRADHLDTSKLEAWLEHTLARPCGPVQLRRFEGGQSNPTYRLQLGDRHLVLRRKPDGPLLKGAHAIEREFCVTQALFARGFPVAEPIAFCEDTAVLGTPFYVMAHVEGRNFWNAALDEIPDGDRAPIYRTSAITIAQLHDLPWVEMGLKDFGRPSGFIQRQTERWSAQYEADMLAGRNPDMDALVDWLRCQQVPNTTPSLVHGDFRLDNMLFDLSTPRVLAVLDWELATLGDPISDFVYSLLPYLLPPQLMGGLNSKLPEGIPSLETQVETYCACRGLSGISHLNFYLAFNLFRFAAILHGIKGRLMRGTAASARAPVMAEQFPVVARLGRQFAEACL